MRPRGILRVIDADGVAVFEDAAAGGARDLAGDGVPDGVDARGRRRRAAPAPRRGSGASASPIGGKTGTTNDFKDAWFVGFSSSIVVGVWVGIRSAADDRRATPTARATRCRSGATSCARRCARGRASEFAVPADAARRTALPHLLPAAGRRLSDLHRVLQGRRPGARPAVPDPSGQHQAAGAPGRRGVPVRPRQADRPHLLALTSIASSPSSPAELPRICDRPRGCQTGPASGQVDSG